LAYQYPEEPTMPGLTPQQALEKLTWDGAAERYPEGLPDEVRPKLEHELRLIERLQYAPPKSVPRAGDRPALSRA
jgi:error-prone DNA polymerase